MRTAPRTLSLAIVILMLVPLATVSAEVSWQHQLTDGTDDVRNLITQENATDRSGLDILAGSIAEQGDDLNVTITLAGAYDSQAAYTLEVECDGDDGRIYSFTYLNDRFAIEGPDLSDGQPEAYISADGKALSWVVPKNDISASERTEVSYVETFRLDGLTPFSDTLPDGGGGGGGAAARRVTPRPSRSWPRSSGWTMSAQPCGWRWTLRRPLPCGPSSTPTATPWSPRRSTTSTSVCST